MPRSAPRPEDLAGLLQGIRHRLEERPIPPRAEILQRLEEGEAALAAGDLASAERTLVAVDEALDREEEEVELTEIPRGLVGYEPIGPRGAPISRDEDQLANRLLLVHRLLEVRRAQGYPVEELVARLAEADRAYTRGERDTARRIGDEVHSRLDALGASPSRAGAMDP